MARSLSHAKLLAASLVDGLSLSISRRGYSVASRASLSASFARGGGSRSAGLGKAEAIKEESGASCAWVPDPVTGYYRPIDHAAEIDAAELREMLLNHRERPH